MFDLWPFREMWFWAVMLLVCVIGFLVTILLPDHKDDN